MSPIKPNKLVCFLLFSLVAAFASEPIALSAKKNCPEEFDGVGPNRNARKPPAPSASGDAAAFNAGKPLVQGGVVHVPVCDQKDSEICWSYGLNEFAGSLLLKDTGQLVVTSPDHNAFWHFYFQFYNHKDYFNQLAKRVASGKISEDDAIKEAKLMLHRTANSVSARAAGYDVQPGSNENIALSEVAQIGFVPDSLYDHPITTPAQGNGLQKGLNSLIKSVLSDPSQLAQFTAKDADGINTPLYNLLTQKLGPYFKSSTTGGQLPFRPNDTFTYNGATYTPLDFMAKEMKFDPTQFTEVDMTDKNKTLVLQAIQESLSPPNSRPVPVGFAVYNQLKAEQANSWTTDILAGAKPELDGGHEVVFVNAKVDGNGNVLGGIAQNSWGEQGLDVNGVVPTDPSQSGFNGISWPYLDYTLQQGEGPSFVFPDSLLNQPQYKTLLSTGRKVKKP